MVSDIKLGDGSVEIVGDKVTTNVGFNGGTVEITGSNVKTSVTDVEMLFYGGRLRAKGGNVELGSSDSGTFKGYTQTREGSLQLTGDKVTVTAATVEIGNRVNGKLTGLLLSGGSASVCGADLAVKNPEASGLDRAHRSALAHSKDDELVINTNGNYRAGVRVDGPLVIAGNASVKSTLTVEVGAELLLATPDKEAHGPGGKTIRIPGTPVDVLKSISELHAIVQALQSRVEALEKALKTR